MRQMAFCPNCYARIPVDAAICPHCRATLSDWQEKTYPDRLIDALGHPLSEVRMRCADYGGRDPARIAVMAKARQFDP